MKFALLFYEDFYKTYRELRWVSDVERSVIVWALDEEEVGTFPPTFVDEDGDFIAEAESLEELKGLYMEYFL